MRATILVPTHEHGSLLRLAVASALAQSVHEIEVFIVLDGPDPETTRVAEGLAEDDPRVRLFPNEKGERHGEAHRHAALQEARGRIVCYLSDDDLWFPDHVAYLDSLLVTADFAHSLTMAPDLEGDVHLPYICDVTDPWYRERMRRGTNFIPFSAAGHTLRAYRHLPVGWSPAPATTYTDLHMWQKFIEAPGIRLRSGGRPTVLHFPSPHRREVDTSRRLTELEAWSSQLRNAVARDDLRMRAGDMLLALAATFERQRFETQVALDENSSRLAEAEERAAEMRESRDAAEQKATDMLERHAEAERRADELAAESAAIRGSVAYRASRRLAGMPVIGRVGRWVGMAISRRADR